jgi:hypothetical protein
MEKQEDNIVQPCVSPSPSLPPVPLKPNELLDFPESLDYWEARRFTSGCPFESEDSDSCSDSDDDTLCVLSTNQFPSICGYCHPRGLPPVDWSDRGTSVFFPYIVYIYLSPPSINFSTKPYLDLQKWPCSSSHL